MSVGRRLRKNYKKQSFVICHILPIHILVEIHSLVGYTVLMYLVTHTHAHIYIYIYIYTHTHTKIHTYIHTRDVPSG